MGVIISTLRGGALNPHNRWDFPWHDLIAHLARGKADFTDVTGFTEMSDLVVAACATGTFPDKHSRYWAELRGELLRAKTIPEMTVLLFKRLKLDPAKCPEAIEWCEEFSRRFIFQEVATRRMEMAAQQQEVEALLQRASDAV